MAYRGEDLDLRTPQTWSGLPAETPLATDPYVNGSRGRLGYTRPTPILVDDIVLACSNHAFDVAVAHRASDVRIEHLLHAMTRIDGASTVLEARGIRIAGLRRESAAIIASEIPIGLSAGQGRPRRSDDFEQVLRQASSIAMRRNQAANVDDVIDALLDLPSDIPGIALLARHGGRVARDRGPARDMPREREPYPPLPSLTRTPPGYTSDVRGPDLRSPEPRKPVQSTYYTNDLSRPLRPDLVGTPTDGIQNARIEQLESAVRTLTSELANERNIVSSVVQDLQRNLTLERDDTSRFRGGLHDRLQSLEQAVLSGSSGSDAGAVIDRLATVERSIDQRLNDLSRPFAVLSDRLQGLEQTVLDTRTSGADTKLIHDRLKTIERALDAAAGRTIDLGPIANRLDIIEEAVLSTDGGQGNDKVVERLRTLEDAIAAQRTLVIQATTGLDNDVKALASALTQQAAGQDRVQSFVTDRMQTLTAGFERQRAELTGPLTDRINALASSLDTRLQGIAGLIDRQRIETTQPLLERVSAIGSMGGESQRMLSAMAERIASLESQLTLSVQRAAEAQATHTAELKEVHEALIKLNTNQHTLAGSIDQWRLDGVGDINVIASRLDGLEKTAARPVQMIETLTTSVDNINRMTVERYHRRNRFWYWLFGTDDWLTASWPSQVASIEAERAALRGSTPIAPRKA
jgi:hypothetical protein